MGRGLTDGARLATLSGPRASSTLASSVVLLLTSARLRLRPALSAGLTAALAHFLPRHARRRALRARHSLRTRRGLPAAAATELPRLARPAARMCNLRRVVLLKAHLVLLIHVRLRAASSLAVSGGAVRCSATHPAGSTAHRCTARARRPVGMG